MTAPAQVVRPARELAAPLSPTRLLIVDDHPAVRVGLEGLLGADPDLLAVVGATAGARDGLRLARHLHPDVAVVDHHLGDGDGISLCHELKALPRPPHVLLFSAYADGLLALGAVVAGADGLLGKGVLGEEIVRAVRTVAAGERVRPPVPREALEAAGNRLDPEDLPVLGMLLHDTPPSEIAQVLGVDEAWLTARRWAILRRLLQPRGRRN